MSSDRLLMPSRHFKGCENQCRVRTNKATRFLAPHFQTGSIVGLAENIIASSVCSSLIVLNTHLYFFMVNEMNFT